MQKRIITLLLSLLCFLLPAMALEVSADTLVDSGTCGDQVSWTLDDAGTLTISGKGPMTDYNLDNDEEDFLSPPWSKHLEKVRAIVVEEGITSLGNCAFSTEILKNAGKTSQLTSVTLPAGLERIGKEAFRGCDQLTKIQIPEGVTTLEHSAFQSCKKLTEIILPDSVTQLPSHFCFNCDALTTITLPDAVTSIGNSAFMDAGLTEITLPSKLTSIGSSAFYDCADLQTITFTGNAPTIGTSAFHGVTATAYYSGRNTTWTADLLKDYDGTITWVADPPGATNYQIQLSSGAITDDHLSGTGWRYDPDSGILYLSSDFSGYISSKRDALTIEVDGSVNVSSLSASTGSLTLQGKTGRSTDGLQIQSGRIVTGGNLTVKKLALDVEQENLIAIEVTGCFTITDASVYASSTGESADNGIRTGTIQVEGASYVSARTSRPALNALYASQSGSSFSDSCHVKTYGSVGSSIYIPGITLPEYAYIYSGNTYNPSLNYEKVQTAQEYSSGVLSGGFDYAFIGTEHASYQQNEDGETHTLVCGCSTATLGPALPCSGGTATCTKKAVCTDCGSEYGQPGKNHNFYNSDTCVCGAVGGSCGIDVFWALEPDGTMRIYGNGAMHYKIPWDDYPVQVKQLVVEPGVTAIREQAFQNCTTLETITMADDVLSIGYWAFSGCTNLTSVTLSENLNDLQWRVFNECKQLTSIEIPSGVTTIHSSTFQNCSKLSSITLPENLTSIGDYAFSGCSMTSITLPETLTTIEDGAFSSCSRLSSITIPAKTVNIGNYVFHNCPKLSSVTLPASMSRISPNMFSDCTALRSITLPEKLTSIGDGAFYGCSALTAITIPQTVSELGSSAFSGCKKLSKIQIPDKVTEIGSYAFSGCDILQTITFPKNLEIIGDSAFTNCPYLTSITLPDSVLSIGAYAFAHCDRLQSITIPDGVEEIGSSAFDTCSALTEIKLPQSLTTISSNMFYQCFMLSKVTIPEGVTTLEARAFAICDSLTEITLPHSLETIDFYAFNGAGLERITIPENVSFIGENPFPGYMEEITFQGDAPTYFNPYAFEHHTLTAYYPADNATWTEDVRQNYGGTVTWVPSESLISEGQCGPDAFWELNSNGKLSVYGTGGTYDYNSSYSRSPWSQYNQQITSLEVAEGITALGQNLFRGLENLETVTLADSITAIDNAAFLGCGFQTLELPENLTEVGSWAFQTCPNLEQVTIPGSLKRTGHGAFANCTALKKIVIPDGMEKIEAYAFKGCTALTTVTIGKNVKTIGTEAFYECPQLTNLALNSQVLETVGEMAFHQCANLTGDLIFPQTLVSIGNSAFSYCTSLTGNVVVPSGILGEFAFSETNIRAVTLGDGVTRVGNRAFQNCPELTTFSLGANLQSIGDDAFNYCENLTGDLVIPDSVTEIGYGAFRGCKNLTSLTLGRGLKAINGDAFNGCSGLLRFSGLPSGLESIGSQAFAGCQNMAGELILPDGLKEVGIEAFRNCRSLTGTLVIPESLTEIGIEAFSNCRNITGTLVIPDTLKEIPNGAFNYCEKLTGLDLGAVTTIGAEAFAKTHGLTEINIPATVTSIGSNAFFSSGLDTITFQGSAPEIHEKAFQNQTLTAYYPGNDPTWTEDVRQDYSGTIDWIPYGGGSGGDVEDPVEYPPELKWFFDKLEDPDNTLWASGTYAKIMEQFR